MSAVPSSLESGTFFGNRTLQMPSLITFSLLESNVKKNEKKWGGVRLPLNPSRLSRAFFCIAHQRAECLEHSN